MPKVYSVVSYRSISDPEKLAAYAALAGPAMVEAGGRFIARGMPAAVLEQGLNERVVIKEFDSIEAALASYETPAYKKALEALGDGAVRDIRIIPAVEAD
ncbi:MAG: DUF1330 domain-containing protein [Pseudomonadota bacterium]